MPDRRGMALLVLALLLAGCVPARGRAPLPPPDLSALLVQPGDLPATLRPGVLATAPPARYAALNVPPAVWVAVLPLDAVDGPPVALPVGMVTLAVYASPATAQAAFPVVVQGISHQTGATALQVVDGLGDEAQGYADTMLAHSAFTRLAFIRCTGVVDLDLWGEVTPEGALTYAQRLDRRLQAGGALGCPPVPAPGTTWAVLGEVPPAERALRAARWRALPPPAEAQARGQARHARAALRSRVPCSRGTRRWRVRNQL